MKKSYGRYSGQRYTNSKERLNEIKERYKNGVTYSDILEMIGGHNDRTDTKRVRRTSNEIIR